MRNKIFADLKVAPLNLRPHSFLAIIRSLFGFEGITTQDMLFSIEKLSDFALGRLQPLVSAGRLDQTHIDEISTMRDSLTLIALQEVVRHCIHERLKTPLGRLAVHLMFFYTSHSNIDLSKQSRLLERRF